MQKISLIILSVACFLTGCAGKPINYDLSNNKTFEPARINLGSTAIEAGFFSYEPPNGLGQYDFSYFGCIPCRSDGTSNGGSFAQPIHEIIKKEVSNIISEITIKPKTTKCKLNGTINMVGINIHGWQVSDITYTLTEAEQDIYKKRIKKETDVQIFGGPSFSRAFSRSTQVSLEELFADANFSIAAKKKCSTQ